MDRRPNYMNEKCVSVVTAIIQLIHGSFIVMAHPSRDKKRILMNEMRYNHLPDKEKSMIDGYPNNLPAYLQNSQPEDGPVNLQEMLYQHVKYSVGTHSTYFLVAHVNRMKISGNTKDQHLSSDMIVAAMVIEKNVTVVHTDSCIIHYICVHPKLKGNGFGSLLLSTVFKKERSLENKRVYAVTKLIKDFTPLDYKDPLLRYSTKELKDYIEKDVKTSGNPLSTARPKYRE